MSSVIPVVVKRVEDRGGAEGEEGIWRVVPQGRLDARTVSALESALESALSQSPRLVVDMSEVPYISSGGLRALMAARRRARAQGGDLRLCGLNERVEEIFDLIGFAALFPIFGSLEEAVESFRQEG